MLIWVDMGIPWLYHAIPIIPKSRVLDANAEPQGGIIDAHLRTLLLRSHDVGPEPPEAWRSNCRYVETKNV